MISGASIVCYSHEKCLANICTFNRYLPFLQPQVSGKFSAIYDAYYNQIDPKGLGTIEAMVAAKFLKKSGLSDVVLSRVSFFFLLPMVNIISNILIQTRFGTCPTRRAVAIWTAKDFSSR